MVHIKTIKMTGFKSFGNSKTVIDLAPGFTCIVGPNGSGKSNAIDAINFCLGTLSKKSMRAEKLTDLLFNGSKGKDPAQSAIVEIELDNKDLKIPVKEETVFISRELKRNGSGVYRLNGKKTTRTDILDKLRIAGIDCVDGFNIIQQGQIGEIVGMSSIQRRELLEGVAGIGQFEDKKEAAIAELDEAQRKMGELNLLINELSARVNQLKREKEAAEKWVKLGEIIKRLRSEFLSYKLSTIEREVDTLSNEVKDQNRMIAELENNKQGLSKLKELEDDIKTNQAKVEELEQKRNMTSEGLNNAKIDLVRLEQLLEFNKTNIEQKNQEIQNIDRDKILATSSIDERQIEIQKISKQLQRLNNQKEDLVQKRTQIEIDIQDRESEFQETQEEMSKIAKQLQDLKEDISTREVSQEISASIVQGFQESKSVTNDQILEIKRVLEATKTKIMSSQEGIDRDTSKLKELQEKIGIYEENLLQQDKKITEKRKNLKAQTDDVLVLKTKIDMINAGLSDEENDIVTKHILKNKHEFPGIINTLKAILGGKENIPKTLNYLSNAIVTQDLNSTLECIRILKEKLIGSCIFIPLENTETGLQDLQKEIEKKVTSTVMIVNDIKDAAKLWETNKSMQIQTITGDIFYPNGLIDGGFHKAAASSQLEPLLKQQKSKEENIDLLIKEEKMLERTKEQIKEVKDTTNNKAMSMEKKIRDSIIQLQHLKERFNQDEAQLNQVIRELGEIERDEIEKKLELDNIMREISELNINRDQIKKRLEETQLVIDSLNVSGLRDKHSYLSEKIIQIEKEKIRIEERRHSFEESIIPSNQRINQLESRKKELLDEIKSLREKENEIGVGIKEKIEAIWQTEQEVGKIDDEISQNKIQITELRRETKRINRKNTKIDKEIQVSKEKINEMKIKRAKLETERDSLITEAKEKELEILKEENILQKIQPDEHKTEIRKLSNNRKNLEPVNMRSIEDHTIQDERLQETLDMKKVLTEERKAILDLIAQLEIEKINTFQRSFNKINRAFEEIFQELANGGARLILDNPEDIFEGGVSIEAHPDGKTLKTLESMSGGEKALTALAFIFAIQQSEPQPFYVLDEIDATLDVKNVDKVGRFIAKMAKGASEYGHAQFIVISHRDILMAKSQSIYGTTNVKGITKIMQLQLDEKGLVTS